MKRSQATLDSIWSPVRKQQKLATSECLGDSKKSDSGCETTEDISTYVKRQEFLTDAEKMYILQKDWTPSLKFEFPKSQCGKFNRSFQRAWLTKFPGLVYSAIEDAAYCVHCVTFPGINRKRGQLASEPFRNWKHALEVFNGHFKDQKRNMKDGGNGYHAHLDSKVCAEQFTASTLTNMPVTKLINTALKAREEKNFRVLQSIAKTVLFCARQNIALRGHRDDSKYLHEEDQNCGNFQALLQFRLDAGDSLLKEHFDTAPKNATYRSKTTQNELIDIMGDIVKKKIVGDVKDGGYFYTISADEVRDVSNKEQLAVCIRFPDKSDTIREEFLTFVDVSSDTSGERLSDEILHVLDSVALDKHQMRGQCYDGAGNMTGKVKGVGPRIQNQYPRALHFWCTAHQLNRCVVHACDNQLVRNMMGTVDRISMFFNFSPKRQTYLEDCRAAQESSENKRMKIKELCRTRWVERHDALELFIDFIPSMVDAMSEIMTVETRSTTSAEISGFLLAITSFQFIVVLTVVTRCLSYIKPLTVTLQGRAVDVVKAMSEVKVVIDAIQDVRSNIDEFHERWYREAVLVAESVGTVPAKPRTCGRQTMRGNVEASTPQDYYKRNLTIEFIDTLLSQMNERFGELQRKAAMGLALIPSFMYDNSQNISVADLEWFSEDLPSSQSLESELHLWQRKWKGIQSPPDTIQKTLKMCSKQLYPNIHTILSVSSVFPVTSCECERSVSVLGLVKTKLRSTMGQERLSSLCLISIHRDIPIDVTKVVGLFAERNPRRMALPNIFMDC